MLSFLYLQEDFRKSLPFFILVGGLAVVFSLQFLLPLTLLLRKIMLDHSQSEYVAWLTTPLLVTTWNKLFFISGIYLFGLIPFAYLSQEASDLKRTLLSAGWETLTQLFFVNNFLFPLFFFLFFLTFSLFFSCRCFASWQGLCMWPGPPSIFIMHPFTWCSIGSPSCYPPCSASKPFPLDSPC